MINDKEETKNGRRLNSLGDRGMVWGLQMEESFVPIAKSYLTRF